LYYTAKTIIEAEKIGHLFWECKEMTMIKNFVYRKTGINVTRQEFLMGTYRWAENKNRCWGWFVMNIKWYILKKSRCKKLPREDELETEIEFLEQSLEQTRYRGIFRTFWA
jgi:hypothetical protein